MADKKISALTGASTPLAGTEVLPIVQSGSTVKVAVSNLTAGRSVATGALTVTGAMSATTSITSGNGLVASGATYPASGTAAEVGYNGTSVYVRGYDRTGSAYKSVVINEGLTIAGGSAGDVTLVANNLVQGTAAKGVNFTANTPAAGMTSQLLNWYEAGTWTAAISDGTNNATLNRSTCRYTRIGRQVTVSGFISATSLGSVTGDIRITGLPFTVGSSDESYSAGAVSYAGNLNITAGQSVTVTAWAGNTYLNLQVWNSAGGTSAMQASQFTASGAIMFSCTYTV